MSILPASIRTLPWQSAVSLIDKLRPQHPVQTIAPHITLGEWGEEAAFFYLRRAGYIVVAQDWRSRKAPGDLDLIGWDGDTLCFVEVKARSSRAVAVAEAAVNAHKRRSLRRLARLYLAQMQDGITTRFDILSIYFEPGRAPRDAEYELFRNAFGWEE